MLTILGEILQLRCLREIVCIPCNIYLNYTRGAYACRMSRLQAADCVGLHYGTSAEGVVVGKRVEKGLYI